MKQVIVFHSGEQSFALKIAYIDKIIEYEHPNRVPETKAYVRGVIKYHDKILPVIDLYERLYGKNQGKKENAKIIVVNNGEACVGLIIDDIVGIKHYHEAQFENPAQFEYNFSKEYVEGFIKDEEEIILLLYPEKLFSFWEVDGLVEYEDQVVVS